MKKKKKRNPKRNKPSTLVKKTAAVSQSKNTQKMSEKDAIAFFEQIRNMNFMNELPKIGNFAEKVCEILRIECPTFCISFELDFFADLVEVIADYNPKTDKLVLRTHCMCKENFGMFQYAVSRELIKKWVYQNDRSDWVHYPNSNIREKLDMEEIADGLAAALMRHFYQNDNWDTYGIWHHNYCKHPEWSCDILEEAEYELMHLLDDEGYYFA